MIIHTLGNEQTDSYAASRQYLNTHHQSGNIILHDSFEEIYQHLADYPGQYLIVPAAFRSRTGASWGTMHYRNIDRLELVDAFITQLAPMVIAKRPNPQPIAYTHAATADLLRRSLPDSVVIKTAPSKYQAYQDFKENGQYVLTSKKLLINDPSVQIIRELRVKMMWSLYRIGGRVDEKNSAD